MSGLEPLLALAEKFSGGQGISLHPERCLNTRFRAIDCSLCAELCPADNAITVTNGQPSLSNEACLRCGLCLHACPTAAFTQPDALPVKLVKTVAALPAGPVDMVCPQHPHPERGPAPQAVQTQRCLAALSPAVLLELAAQGREIWLDDTPCAGCVLGKVQPALAQSVAEANGWSRLLARSRPIYLRTGQPEPQPASERPVYPADRLPVSRRGLFSALKKTGAELAAAEEGEAMLKTGKSVPVVNRLPHAVPRRRAKILDILNTHPRNPASAPQTSLPAQPRPAIPVLEVGIKPDLCTACGLCARFCPTEAIRFLSDGEQFALVFRPGLCLGPACNICVPACPEQAVFTREAAVSADLLAKKSLHAGDLAACQKCGEPIASGPGLPKTCFACRPKTATARLVDDLFG